MKVKLFDILYFTNVEWMKSDIYQTSLRQTNQVILVFYQDMPKDSKIILSHIVTSSMAKWVPEKPKLEFTECKAKHKTLTDETHNIKDKMNSQFKQVGPLWTDKWLN